MFTLEGVLFTLLQLSLLLNWPVAIILIRAANRKPRIRALTVMAVISTLVALGLTAYVWAVLNSAFGFPISRETAQIIFRAVLLLLGLFPVWFLWLYLTGRFSDDR